LHDAGETVIIMRVTREAFPWAEVLR